MIRPEGPRDSGRISVLGIGNILLSDEGVGVHAVNAIKKKYAFSPEIEILDGGTMGLDLLPIFQTQDKIIIIDAVDFKKEPGHVGAIEGNKIPTVLNTKLSVHHIGFSDLLYAAKLTRDIPPEVYLIGIQPKSFDVGLEMTDEIRMHLDDIIELAIQKLKEWDVQISLKTRQ
ncbi:MAG TPA: HyaD/HybD family hydrogenase maturation endopeptidase [Nitrospirota bacterium]|nr:HyaD/HybD family hydrogenase maturation endopeptidase [Nitrospirota bacterium]